MNRKHLFVAAFCSATISTAGVAGEIKGPPPTGNYTGTELDINSRSICVFSGLNDSPLGDPDVGDPGGRTQSFGSFFGSSGFPDFWRLLLSRLTLVSLSSPFRPSRR